MSFLCKGLAVPSLPIHNSIIFSLLIIQQVGAFLLLKLHPAAGLLDGTGVYLKDREVAGWISYVSTDGERIDCKPN